MAKLIGISRSNAYNSLASMTEKGASYLVEEGTTRKYVPVPLDEFCKNRVRRMEENKKWLCAHMPAVKDRVEGYITIEGAANILDKMRNLIDGAKERVYVSCTRNYLLLLIKELESLIQRRKKVFLSGIQTGIHTSLSIFSCKHTVGINDQADCGSAWISYIHLRAVKIDRLICNDHNFLSSLNQAFQ